MPLTLSMRRTSGSGRVAVRFIFASVFVYLTAGAVAFVFIHFFPGRVVPEKVVFPTAFWFTTVLLAVGSGFLHRAAFAVRHERQTTFRESLLVALVAGTLFVGLQTYGLASLARNQLPEEAQTGANAFITMLAALHAMHFALALLFLVWVTLNALADRYDHEYSWGVTVCAWFWHVLGVVWMLILVVFAIAAM